MKNICHTGSAILVTIILATGCKPHSPSNPETASANYKPSSEYFQTPFQEESQYIVEAIVSDLAEEMYYAATHRLPDPKYFDVTATEKSGSPQDAPVYELEIRLDPKKETLKAEVNVNGPIWSPAVYKDLTAEVAQAVGLTSANMPPSNDTSLLSTLTDNAPETIEQQNEQLSQALQQDFENPQLHEEAAALLGAFLLRDHSGYFFEIRSPLSRMTAHLAMAQFFNGNNSFGINGQMAEAMLYSLINDQALALDQLNAVGTNNVTITPIVRALWTRNTGDYRLLGQMNNLTPVESAEWFCAMADYVSAPMAWTKLSDVQQGNIDFARIANQESYSVEMGHQLLDVSIPLELREIGSVYELSHHKSLGRNEFVKALNEMPERCFAIASDGTVHVCVIGWGQWADFLQRHLCHAIQSNFDFMQYRWGVPDDAKEFASKCDQEFSGLRLYPFVERFDCTDVNSYHKSVDDGFKVTVATPQLTPASCWNEICYNVDFAPPYQPSSNPHVNEWHHHNPPPGTVYDLGPRLDHPSLTDRPDAVPAFEKLHDFAPYDCRVMNFILKHKYNNQAGYDQALELYSNLLPYSLTAMTTVAKTVRNQPEQYEKLMLQAAVLSPTCYYTLGDYELNHDEEDKAAQDYDKGCDADPDSVRVSNYSLWRTKYYLKKGQTEKARQIADYGGQVYSYCGLQAEGVFYETTSNYDQAFQWYQNIEDRYNDNGPLISFCLRYKSMTGDTRFDSELQKRMGKLFPKGIEKVSLADFNGPPRDGVLIRQQNDLIISAGLRAGDVIVAIGGTRTHTFAQYTYVRDSQSDPLLDLIVWQGDAYHEIKASPPDHHFGVDFGDYKPQ